MGSVPNPPIAWLVIEGLKGISRRKRMLLCCVKSRRWCQRQQP